MGNKKQPNPFTTKSHRDVDPRWTLDELLEKDAVFNLKDVAALLPDLETRDLRNVHDRFKKRGEHPMESMGVGKILGSWIVSMKEFALYYKNVHLPNQGAIQEAPDVDTLHELFQLTGVFRLKDIAAYLPIQEHAIQNYMRDERNRLAEEGKSETDTRDLYGIWLDPGAGIYLVDMEPFSQWFSSLIENA